MGERQNKMKILSMAWSIYDERIEKFQNNCTGGGLMIKNICEYIGKKEESYLFIGSCHLPEIKIGNIHIVRTDMKIDDKDNDLVRNETYINNMTKKFALALEDINPDIVNFHGLGVLVQHCIQVCVEKKIPYVYTEHLYIGLNEVIENYGVSVEWEKMLFNIPQLPIIAVSHGMKEKILQDFPKSQIKVILNGTDFIAQKVESDYRNKYNLQNKKILLCVGTISARKNQKQIVDAYLKLPIEIQDNLRIIFCGRDSAQGRLQESIYLSKLKDKLIYVGAVSSKEMKKYYSIADGLIMPSLAEGLSIAALEAIAYGLPVIMFSDSECAKDLNNEKVTCFAEKRDDNSLAKAIRKWYICNWDRDYIIKFSKYFSMERVAEDYINYYKYRLSNETNRLY